MVQKLRQMLTSSSTTAIQFGLSITDTFSAHGSVAYALDFGFISYPNALHYPKKFHVIRTSPFFHDFSLSQLTISGISHQFTLIESRAALFASKNDTLVPDYIYTIQRSSPAQGFFLYQNLGGKFFPVSLVRCLFRNLRETCVYWRIRDQFRLGVMYAKWWRWWVAGRLVPSREGFYASSFRFPRSNFRS